MKKALLLVDPQNDFCSSKGSLYVPKGEEIIPVANRLMVSGKFDLCIISADWHPPTHKSFISNNPGKKVGDVFDLNGVPQIVWPNHCEPLTWGSEFHKNLLTGKLAAVFRKGMDPEVDSYSAFADNGKRHTTGLGGYLKELEVKELYVACVATDYCVKFTVLDALALGFNVNLVLDGCRAVNLKPDDGKNAVAEMKAAGAKIVKSEDLIGK